MKKRPGRPILPPLAERAVVDRLGDAVVLRSREAHGLLVLAEPDLRELRRFLADRQGGKA